MTSSKYMNFDAKWNEQKSVTIGIAFTLSKTILKSNYNINEKDNSSSNNSISLELFVLIYSSIFNF